MYANPKDPPFKVLKGGGVKNISHQSSLLLWPTFTSWCTPSAQPFVTTFGSCCRISPPQVGLKVIQDPNWLNMDPTETNTVSQLIGNHGLSKKETSSNCRMSKKNRGGCHKCIQHCSSNIASKKNPHPTLTTKNFHTSLTWLSESGHDILGARNSPFLQVFPCQ